VISYTGPHTLCIAAEDVAEEELQGSPAGAGQHWGAGGRGWFASAGPGHRRAVKPGRVEVVKVVVDELGIGEYSLVPVPLCVDDGNLARTVWPAPAQFQACYLGHAPHLPVSSAKRACLAWRLVGALCPAGPGQRTRAVPPVTHRRAVRSTREREMPASWHQRGQRSTSTGAAIGLPPAASSVTPDAYGQEDDSSRVARSLQA
jgi:hypothetical protein